MSRQRLRNTAIPGISSADGQQTRTRGSEAHNKRKVSFSSLQRKVLISRSQEAEEGAQASATVTHTLVGISPNLERYPHKKQRVMASQDETYLSDGCGECGQKDEHYIHYGILRRLEDVTSATKNSSSYSGSSTDTVSSDNDSRYSTDDSRTTISGPMSRSSSCRPEPLVHIVALQDSKSPIFPSGSHQEMHSMIGCQFVELCKEPLSIDDSNSNTRSMFDISANFRPQQMIFSFGEDHSQRKLYRNISKEPEMDRISSPTSNDGVPESPARAPSHVGTGDPSTGDDDSSQSHTSKTPDTNGDTESEDLTTLPGLIRHLLRTEPAVAERLIPKLEEYLECAAPNSDMIEDSDLSMLNLLELQDSRPLQTSFDFTACASSSSGDRQSDFGTRGSAPSHSSCGITVCAYGTSGDQQSNFGAQAGMPPSDGQNNAPADNSMGFGHPSNSGHGPTGLDSSIKGRNLNPKANRSSGANLHLFRCIHNALDSNAFCINQETLKKYATCSGSGWKTIAHLKDHIKNIHTKKPNLLKCSRCQDELATQEELRSHQEIVDCLIRCPFCKHEFETKAKRQSHLQKEHMDDNTEPAFMEIDEAMSDKIKERLKIYGEDVKRGRDHGNATMDEWIKKNTQQYMIGRPSKANAKLELGQWYTIFCTLSTRKILDSPFYDFKILPSDLAAEKILLINKDLVDARIEEYGQPPPELTQQKEWYNAVLRDTLRIAAKTNLVLPPNRISGGQSSDFGASPMAAAFQDLNHSSNTQPPYWDQSTANDAMNPELFNNLGSWNSQSNLQEGIDPNYAPFSGDFDSYLSNWNPQQGHGSGSGQ